MTRLANNKKGSAQDVIYVGAIMFALAVIAVFIYAMMLRVDAKIQSSSQFTSEGKSLSTKLSGYFTSIIDKAIVFFFVISMIVAVVMAMLIRVHPAFIFIYILVLAIGVYTSAMMANGYEQMATSTQLASSASGLTFTTLVMRYLPWFVAVFGIIIMAVMYKTGEW